MWCFDGTHVAGVIRARFMFMLSMLLNMKLCRTMYRWSSTNCCLSIVLSLPCLPTLVPSNYNEAVLVPYLR